MSALLLLATACGTSPTEVDSGAPVDGSPPDAAVADGDGDGVATAVDCDDADPSVGASATRSCTSDCAAGTESCTDGAWSACSATTDCACDTPGEMRTVECGRCGVASQSCGADNRWEMPSECFGEQACFAAEIERDESMCGQRARICDDTCQWRPWETMVAPGECEAGEVGRTDEGCTGSETRERSCSAMCGWELTGTCELSCVGSPAPSMSGADPVCIAAGQFELGSQYVGDGPVIAERGTITLSEFYVDRFPVTRSRYELCRSAGTCPAPGMTDLYSAGPDDTYAKGLNLAATMSFCSWDGGQLINEFQWARAARGPSPDQRLRPWGEPIGECRHHPYTDCLDPHFSVGSFPDNVSPWGVRLMGALEEFTSSQWDRRLRDVPSVDPTGEPAVTAFTIRGAPWIDDRGGRLIDSQSLNGAVYRRDYPVDPPARLIGFRCVY